MYGIGDLDYTWTDGSAVNFSNWDTIPRQPSRGLGAAIRKIGSGKWWSSLANESYCYICEIKPGEIRLPIPTFPEKTTTLTATTTDLR